MVDMRLNGSPKEALGRALSAICTYGKAASTAPNTILLALAERLPVVLGAYDHIERLIANAPAQGAIVSAGAQHLF